MPTDHSEKPKAGLARLAYDQCDKATLAIWWAIAYQHKRIYEILAAMSLEPTPARQVYLPESLENYAIESKHPDLNYDEVKVK